MTWTVKNGDFQLKMPLSHTVVRYLLGVVRSHFFADPFFPLPPPPPLLPIAKCTLQYCTSFLGSKSERSFWKRETKMELTCFCFFVFSMIEQYSWGHPALLASPTARTRLHSCRWTVEDYSVRVVETAEGFRKGSRWPKETSHSKLKSVPAGTRHQGLPRHWNLKWRLKRSEDVAW